MRVNFKVIGGRSTTLKVTGQTRVSELKRLLGNELGVASIQLTLLYKGATLSDEKNLTLYALNNDDTVNVNIKKLPQLQIELYDMFSEEVCDASLALSKFNTIYTEWLDSLNLDDIEMVCKELETQCNDWEMIL